MLIKTVSFQLFTANFQANSTSIPLLVREMKKWVTDSNNYSYVHIV